MLNPRCPARWPLSVAGILAAALSSVDSALNSLSAVTLGEIFPQFEEGESRPPLLWARFGTLAWGAWATASAWWFSRAGETVIELVNRIGSLVYGPYWPYSSWRGAQALETLITLPTVALPETHPFSRVVRGLGYVDPAARGTVQADR